MFKSQSVVYQIRYGCCIEATLKRGCELSQHEGNNVIDECLL